MKSLQQHLADIKAGDRRLIFAVLGIGFFLLYSWLYLSTPEIFNSPDETATWVFARQWSATGALEIPFAPNPENLIRPRSVNIIGANMVPGGFVGLILAVGMTANLSTWLALALPALLAVAGVFSFYVILRRVFDEQIAFFSLLLTFFLPPWWHFAAKGFLPNVPFLSLLLLAVAMFLHAHDKMKRAGRFTRSGFIYAAMAGLALGGAMAIRPSEFWWVGSAALAGLLAYRAKVRWMVVILTILFAALPLAFTFTVQADTYGSPLNTGYEQYQSDDTKNEQSIGSLALKTLFPFGINLSASAVNFANFGLSLFWWLVIFWLAGLIAWFKQKERSKEQLLYTALLFAISMYLIVYYGSWAVTDDLDTDRVSIGVSYIRYWLPFFLGMTPFLVLGLKTIAARLGGHRHSQMVFLSLLALMLGINTVFVFWAKDGLREIRENVVNYSEIRAAISSVTRPQAVIINERNDKIFWPDRQVIQYEGQDYGFVENLPQVMGHYPVLWLTILPDDHVRIWEQRSFAPHGLMLDPVDVDLPNNYRLYQVLFR